MPVARFAKEAAPPSRGETRQWLAPSPEFRNTYEIHLGPSRFVISNKHMRAADILLLIAAVSHMKPVYVQFMYGSVYKTRLAWNVRRRLTVASASTRSHVKGFHRFKAGLLS